MGNKDSRAGPGAPPGPVAMALSPAHSHVVQVPGAEEDAALPVPVGVDGVSGGTVVRVKRTLGRRRGHVSPSTAQDASLLPCTPASPASPSHCHHPPRRNHSPCPAGGGHDQPPLCPSRAPQHFHYLYRLGSGFMLKHHRPPQSPQLHHRPHPPPRAFAASLQEAPTPLDYRSLTQSRPGRGEGSVCPPHTAGSGHAPQGPEVT